MSQLTTHILDTSSGLPAGGIVVILYGQQDNGWTEITRGETNTNGRLHDLLPEEQLLAAGVYKLHFIVKDYFERNDSSTFYPFIDVVFEITNNEHYHVPLLLNPFGYSTYRGS